MKIRETFGYNMEYMCSNMHYDIMSQDGQHLDVSMLIKAKHHGNEDLFIKELVQPSIYLLYKCVMERNIKEEELRTLDLSLYGRMRIIDIPLNRIPFINEFMKDYKSYPKLFEGNNE